MIRLLVGGSVLGLLMLVGVIALVVFARTRLVHYEARSSAMEPHVQKGSLVVVDHTAYERTPPQRDDIVALFPPAFASSDGFAVFLRVVGVPGDRVAIRGGRLYLGGKRVDEPYEPANYEFALHDYGVYVNHRRLAVEKADIPPRPDWSGPDAVPRRCYVVLGDNRRQAVDSHVWGFLCPKPPGTIDGAELLGRVVIPFS